ncbi:MAG: hypothetical protein LQ338_007177 [Usnochroma carphineum]|nr:MAG: hypothetical protein LQ338_007177 [Usnochroma carphineum]
MNELARIAAESVGSKSCRNVEKYQEGQYNKVFLVTTEDGKEVIAKVPQPNAGRPHFTTASEVATMDYARNVLDLPVPEVYAWNSKASTSSVGAEYIIMEKAPGVELGCVWPKLHGKQRIKIVKQLIHFQKRFTASTFSGIGSLYYAESLEDGVSSISVGEGTLKAASSSKNFVLGPITDERFFEEGRGEVACGRGPCTLVILGLIFTPLILFSGSSTEDYLVALGLHELSYVRCAKKPLSPGIFGGPGGYQPSIAGKVAALEDYVKIARYLPLKEPAFTAAVLWHDDLHSGNIFVHPDDPSQITSIIDWHTAYISPLIRHRLWPALLDFEGPKPLLGWVGDARKAPELPANYQELSGEEQKDAEALVRQQSSYKLFEIYSAKENPNVSRALLHQPTPRCHLIDYAAITAHHTEPYVKALLIELVDAWERIVGPEGPSCPLHYSEHERKIRAKELNMWSDCCDLLDSVNDSLGVPTAWNGEVSGEGYGATREKLRVVREEFLDNMAKDDEERAEWAKAWPYDDDEEVNE